MEIETKEKVILKQIPINYKYENDEEIVTHFTHKVIPRSVDDLIQEDSEDIFFANAVQDNVKKERENFSQQQIDFSYEAARLITGRLKENKPVLVPVRCGFGKSTIIWTILYTKISQQIKENKPLEDMGIIVVTERLKDLRKMQRFIFDNFGYYNQFQYNDKQNKLQDVKVPWMYIMESWNASIGCRKRIKSYNESLEQCPLCEFRGDCKLGSQYRDQSYSPIIGITTSRLYHYADSGQFGRIRNWKSKGKDVIQLKRNLLLVDEKPKLTKVKNISEKTIHELIDAVSKIDECNSRNIRQDKKKLKDYLVNIETELKNIIEINQGYRNAYINPRKEILSQDFMRLWKTYTMDNYKAKINDIADMFSNGAVFCRTGKYDIFKTVSMANFILNDIKTIIFDGTAELSLEYDQEDFNLLDVSDFREYSNVTFHVVTGNYSKTKVKNKAELLKPIIDWTNKNIDVPVYVVSYMNVSGYLYDSFKENKNVIKDKEDDNFEYIPYFGNTKGKNNFNECTKMIQIGWNRWDSDSYIAKRIATSKLIKKKFDDEYEKNSDYCHKLLENDNGVFCLSDIEKYKNMQRFNDFEQEVFRTKIREFTSEEPIDVYVFNCNKVMQTMIEQRFVNCTIIEEEWREIAEYKIRNRANASSMILLKFLDWLKEWDGNYIPVKQVKDINNISDNYWKKINKNKHVSPTWNSRGIKTVKYEGKYCLVADGKGMN